MQSRLFGNVATKRRFEDYGIPFPRAINIISSSVGLSGRFSKGAMSSSIDEFLILKCFLVGGHPPKAPMIKQVIWTPLFAIGLNVTRIVQLKGPPVGLRAVASSGIIGLLLSAVLQLIWGSPTLCMLN